MSISVVNNLELCYRGTVRHGRGGGGSVIAAFFLAHNYLSEQFGNYVKYGICQVSILRDSRRYAQPILETVDSRLEAFIHELSIVCPSFVHRLYPPLRGEPSENAQLTYEYHSGVKYC